MNILFDLFILWQCIALDCNCSSISAAIRPTLSCIKQFAEYADALLKSKDNIPKLPQFIRDDIRATNARTVYGVLRFPYRVNLDTDPEKSQALEYTTMRKLLASNDICRCRVRGYVKELLQLTIRFPQQWLSSVNKALSDGGEVTNFIKRLVPYETDNEVIPPLTPEQVFDCYTILSTGKFRRDTFTVCEQESSETNLYDRTTLPGVIEDMINKQKALIKVNDLLLVPTDKKTSVELGLFAYKYKEANPSVLMALTIEQWYSHNHPVDPSSVFELEEVPDEDVDSSLLTQNNVYLEGVICPDVLLPVLSSNGHFTLTNMLHVILLDFFAQIINMQLEWGPCLKPLARLYAASCELHSSSTESVADLYYKVMDEVQYSNPPIDVNAKYEKIETVHARYEWLKSHPTEHPTFARFASAYRRMRGSTVPKTLGKLRTIGTCSLRMQADSHYPGIALKAALQSIQPDSYSFYDQEAQVDRLDHGWLTLDASSASDLQDLFQVAVVAFGCDFHFNIDHTFEVENIADGDVSCLRGGVRESIWHMMMRLRPYILETDQGNSYVFMYGGMGHNLTYVAQTMTFRSAVKIVTDCRSMFIGDDGTVQPFVGAEEILPTLYSGFGWKLNIDKSFLTAGGNGECVGAFRWTYDDVDRPLDKPVICDYVFASRGKGQSLSLEDHIAALSLEHVLKLNNFESATAYLADCLLRSGITATSSNSPYEVWLDDAPSYVKFRADGTCDIMRTCIKFDSTSVDLTKRSDIINEMKHYFLSNAPAVKPDARRWVKLSDWCFVKRDNADHEKTGNLRSQLTESLDNVAEFLREEIRNMEIKAPTHFDRWFANPGYALVHQPVEHVMDITHLSDYELVDRISVDGVLNRDAAAPTKAMSNRSGGRKSVPSTKTNSDRSLAHDKSSMVKQGTDDSTPATEEVKAPTNSGKTGVPDAVTTNTNKDN